MDRSDTVQLISIAEGQCWELAVMIVGLAVMIVIELILNMYYNIYSNKRRKQRATEKPRKKPSPYGLYKYKDVRCFTE